MTVVPNYEDELVAQRTVVGYRMCIDFRKLNKATHKDHYPLPFIDEMLERLSKHSHFCYLDGYSGFSQIPVHMNDQEKTTFTCHLVNLLIGECLLVYVMRLLLFRDA